jgi:hypothetical protein
MGKIVTAEVFKVCSLWNFDPVQKVLTHRAIQRTELHILSLSLGSINILISLFSCNHLIYFILILHVLIPCPHEMKA